MTKVRHFAAAAVCAAAWLAAPASAQAPADVSLWRLDCGTAAKPTAIAERFSDTFSYPPDKLQPLTPAQIKYVGISHYHPDHTSQLPSLGDATLLIGKGDWDAITAPKPAQGVNAAAFTHWTELGGKVEPLTVDKDVFGDGSVVVLRTPGHTPGHSSLLVRLKEKGAVILTGDAAHFHENYDSNGVPAFNYDRAETIASLDRIKKIAANLKATVIIQHDPRDIGKLPAFPAAAR